MGTIKRIDAGTDVALIGAWDAGRSGVPLDGANGWMDALDRDVAANHLFLIHTEADGGGPIDVYVEGEIPPNARRHARALGGEYLLAVPSGRLVVGGAEDYRAAVPRITSDSSVVNVAAGNYLL